MNATSKPPGPQAPEERRKLFRKGDLVAGRYRILRFVARGGMGEVYAAEDRDLGQEVALKAVRPEVAVHAQTLQRFRREINLSRQVTHHHVCRIYDAGTHHDEDLDLSIRFLTMELLGGQTLTRHLRRHGPMSTGEVFPIAVQVASGLAAAHNAGVVHRDFKTSNVLLADAPRGVRAVITDFGLSQSLRGKGDGTKESDPLTGTGQLMGTLAYLAPEQLEGKDATPATDIYSFGVVLFQMITGRLPFEGGSPLMAALKRLHEDPPDPAELVPDLDPTWRRVLLRCLRRDASERYQSCEELLEDLGVEILNDSSATHQRPVFDTLGSGPVALPAPVVQAADDPAETDGSGSATALPRQRLVPLWKATVGMVLVGLAVAVASFLTPEIAGPGDRLRVAVSHPVVHGGEDAEYAASGFESALLRSLTALDGVRVIDPRSLEPPAASDESPAEILERAAADEVMRLEATRQSREWLLVIQRYGPDAEVLWSDEFLVPDDDPRLQADAIRAAVRRAYPNHRPESEQGHLPISDDEYAEFLRLRYQVESGSSDADWRVILADLEDLARRAPAFLEIHLYRARVALLVYRAERKQADLATAFAALTRAREVAPGDPRPLLREVDVALRSGHPARADRALAELQQRAPGDVSTLVAEARVSRVRGDLSSAIRQMERAVQIRPARRYLYDLASMQFGAGRIDAARDTLDRLIETWPEYHYGHQRLAELEMVHGDLDRAGELFTRLVDHRREPADLSNLATLYQLRGEYEKSVELFRQLGADYSRHPNVVLGWADAEGLVGNEVRAGQLYRQTLNILSPLKEGTWSESIIRAQAHAQLGERDAALDAIERSLRLGGERGQTHLWAALVYVLTGELDEANRHAEEARSLGVAERWFTLPWFRPLVEEKEAADLSVS